MEALSSVSVVKILVTGFKPFLSEKINPSELLATDLGKKFPNVVTSFILPVEFGRSYEVLKDVLKAEKFDYILMLGQAAGREKICFEKIALNWVQSESPDEANIVPSTRPIAAEQPLALMSSFPVDQVYQALQKEGLPVSLSFSAGTYVCNELYFKVSAFEDVKSVFVHVPLIEEQVKEDKPRPFIGYAEQLEVMQRMISVLLLEQ
ncbi:pyroglutamyl-peptidase I [Pseudobdellovibrio exovorus]|uniref:Pyroglutamyl-peptidase I n=1 Tax=Pseudobdellovibrio exovorus JSS TaxID=1184267 RepID=M4V9N4_9BACT|nr:pyroglutamyl-peptidase I [Pseudobdellovibrio exovorus]AGH95155.1 hypothetical protein A11Q_939 [Pseudobdellovibrio exovorus JSS]